jgi:hypothetical protein
MRQLTVQGMKPSLAAFKPKFLSDLIRLGREFDGGYVVNERAIRASRYLLAFGINDDWSFEEDFLKRNSNVRIYCYDFSVSKTVFRIKALNALNGVIGVEFALYVSTLRWKKIRERLAAFKHWILTYFRFNAFLKKTNVHFHSKGISNQKNEDFITLSDVFQMLPRQSLHDNSVFVKMDIEQSEYRVLPELLDFKEYINGFVVEFHDLDILWNDFNVIIDSLRPYYEITHVHSNNHGPLIPGSNVPIALEITFIKKNLISERFPDRENVTYPIPGLDHPNMPSAKDHPLVF